MVSIRRFEERLGQLVALGYVAETGALATGREALAVALALAGGGSIPIVSMTGEHALLLARGLGASELYRALMTGRTLSGEAAGRGVSFVRTPQEALASLAQQVANGSPGLTWLVGMTEDLVRLPELARIGAGRSPAVVLAEIPISDVNELKAPAGWRCETADGIDARRVTALCAEAVERARRNEGPTLILARTERFHGHMLAATRIPGTKERARTETDPIARLRQRMIDDRTVAEPALKAIEKEIREAIACAGASAREEAEAPSSRRAEG
jgi:TPP-dependent pyruvate/acetoin dehydrogenase alpha subunit